MTIDKESKEVLLIPRLLFLFVAKFMKISIFLIFEFIVFLCSFIPLRASDVYFFDGFDAFIQKELSAKGYSSALYYSPSLRFSDAGRLSNLRFNGNYGEWEPNFPVHPQAITLEDQGVDFCPHDDIAAFIQILFPSPGGIIAQPNQAISDPISTFSFEVLGTLLQRVEECAEFKTIQQFKDGLYGLLFASPKLEHEYIEDYKNFLRYDFKKNLSLSLVRVCEGISEEDFEDSGIPLSDKHLYTKVIDKISPYLFDKKLLQKGEIEEYIAYWQMYNEVKKLNFNSNNKKITVEDHERLHSFEEQYQHLLHLEKNRDIFKKIIFVETLANALLQQQQDREHYSYPPFIVQRALIGYVWKKVRSEEDIIAWLSGLLKLPEDSLGPIIQPRFSLQSYHDWKAKIVDQSPLRDEILSTPEKVAFLAWAYQLFDAPLPPFIPYRTALFNGKSFPDCVESALRYFLTIVSRKKAEYGFKQDINIFSPTSLAYAYFKEYADPDKLFLPEAHNAWGTLTAAKKGIVYCKPSTAAKEKRNYEIRSGMLNILNSLTLLLANADQETSLITFPEGEKAIEEALKHLVHRFHREDLALELEGKLELSPDQERQDYFDKLPFKINGKTSFIWHILRGHSTIEILDNADNDWRKGLPLESLLQKPQLKEMLPWFLNAGKFKAVFPQLSAVERASLCYGMDLKPLENKMAVIETIFKHRQASLNNFASSLIKSIVALDDIHAKNLLISTLIPLAEGRDPIITDEEMCSIIARWPTIMEGHLTLQETPYPISQQAIIWAYNNKKNWVNLAASKTVNLHLDQKSPWREFLSLLPQFKELSYFSFFSSDFKDENVPLLCSSISQLEELEFLYLHVESNSMTVTGLTTLLGSNLPPRLEELKVHYTRLEEDQLAEAIKDFFARNPEVRLHIEHPTYGGSESSQIHQNNLQLYEIIDQLGVSREQLQLKEEG